MPAKHSAIHFKVARSFGQRVNQFIRNGARLEGMQSELSALQASADESTFKYPRPCHSLVE